MDKSYNPATLKLRSRVWTPLCRLCYVLVGYFDDVIIYPSSLTVFLKNS